MAELFEITGRVDDRVITRYIDFYQPKIPEQLLTAKRDICDEFEKLGYKREFVQFDDEKY